MNNLEDFREFCLDLKEIEVVIGWNRFYNFLKVIIVGYGCLIRVVVFNRGMRLR